MTAMEPIAAAPPAILSFEIAEPFETSLRLLRRALRLEKLQIAAEIDMAGRLHQELGVGLSPCRLILVDNPVLTLEGLVFDRAAPLFLPQALVLAEKGGHSLILMRGDTILMESGLPEAAREPLTKLRARIMHSLEGLAKPRHSLFQFNWAPQ